MNNDAFLVLFLVFIALMTMCPMLMRRFRVPGVISLLIVGMLMGPNCLNLVKHLSGFMAFFGSDPAVVESHFNFLVSSFGALGLVFLMALAGLEADFKLIESARKPVIALSLLTFLLPAATGYLVYRYFRPEDLPGKLLYASLFASHSVGIVFPVIRELKLSKTKFGAAVLISTVITDIASIILLAVSVQVKKQLVAAAGSAAIPAAAGDTAALTVLAKSSATRTLSIFDYVDTAVFGSWFTVIFLAIVVVYLLASVWVVTRIGRMVARKMKGNEDALITFLLLVILGTVLAGELLGINLVVGAFIAGLALSGLIKHHIDGTSIFHRFEGIGYGLMIPFLFVSIGMETDFSAFSSVGNVWIILLTVAGLVGSKIFSGWLAMRMSGFRGMSGLCAGLMTVPQLSATLAAASIGKSLGMLDDNFFNAIIILSIVTTLPVPNLVRWVIGHYQLQFEDVDKEAYRIPDRIEDDLI